MARNRYMRRRGLFGFGRNVSEMYDGSPIGKVDKSGWGMIRTSLYNLFKYKTTLDSTKNDYSLYRSLYYGSNVGGTNVHESMYLGSSFVKPIVNSTMAFALGTGFDVKMAGASENEGIEAVQQDLQQFVERNFGTIYDWIKYGTRDGDGFVYIDEHGGVTELKAETVDVVVDAINGELIGYNVEENVEIVDPNTGTKTKYTYLKQYRHSYVRVTRWKDGKDQSKGEIVFERIFVNGEDVDTQARDENGDPIKIEVYEDDLDKRPLPIVHYKNEPEPGMLYGNSEIQNILYYIRGYGEVVDKAIWREKYNNTPVMAMYGIDEPAKDKRNGKQFETSEDGEKSLDWQDNTTLYFKDAKGKAEFLSIPNTMDNTGKLLEYLFYNIIQASETPEFVLGTAVQSSNASVDSQMPVVVKKAERKRVQIRRALLEFLKLYVSRQIELSNPIYFALQGADPELDIDFPDIIGEDKTLVRETIEALLAEGAITRETAVKLSAIGPRVEDPEAEAKAGLEDLRLRNDANNIIPEEQDRLDDELSTGDGGDDPLDNLDEE